MAEVDTLASDNEQAGACCSTMGMRLACVGADNMLQSAADGDWCDKTSCALQRCKPAEAGRAVLGSLGSFSTDNMLG